MRIARELAQSVVDTMMRDLDYSVNIMDADGRIVGSGDADRIGEEHLGAMRALREGQIVEIIEDTAAARQGINLPIELDGHRIGVVGITGPPQRVRPVARVVRSAVTLLIRQQQRLAQEAERQSRRDLLCDRLVGWVGVYPVQLVADAAEHGLDLTRSQVAVLICGSGFEDRDAGPDLGLALRGSGTFALTPAVPAFVAATDRGVDDTIRAIQRRWPHATFAVGSRGTQVGQSLAHARAARQVAARLRMTDRAVFHGDIEVLCALVEAQVPDRRSRIEALADHPDLIETIRALWLHDGNHQESAATLCIHRNTLAYRLDRIETLTGRSPRHLSHLVELVYDLIRAPEGAAPESGTPRAARESQPQT